MVKRAKRNNTDPKVASILLHFDTTYTADLGRLAVFQQLCKDLDVVVGRSLTQCKKNVKQANVNIHDFVRVQRAGSDLSTVKFSSNAALRRDIRDNPSRRFPLYRAKENELVEAMLINI